ncbi:hypothetical protein B0H10DRAFT_2378216 [Mycena sp. CBHHK59/15]|nr:hypothetical protein B0H10DRAFT_2378216 [Mycena sp. CBHHK59/15]
MALASMCSPACLSTGCVVSASQRHIGIPAAPWLSSSPSRLDAAHALEGGAHWDDGGRRSTKGDCAWGRDCALGLRCSRERPSGGELEVGDTRGSKSPALTRGTPDASCPSGAGMAGVLGTGHSARVLAGELSPRRSSPQITMPMPASAHEVVVLAGELQRADTKPSWRHSAQGEGGRVSACEQDQSTALSVDSPPPSRLVQLDALRSTRTRRAVRRAAGAAHSLFVRTPPHNPAPCSTIHLPAQLRQHDSGSATSRPQALSRSAIDACPRTRLGRTVTVLREPHVGDSIQLDADIAVRACESVPASRWLPFLPTRSSAANGRALSTRETSGMVLD